MAIAAHAAVRDGYLAACFLRRSAPDRDVSARRRAPAGTASRIVVQARHAVASPAPCRRLYRSTAGVRAAC